MVTLDKPATNIFEGLHDDRRQYRVYRDGAWTDRWSGRTITITSPIDNSRVGDVPALTRDEIDQVFAAAVAAQPAWAARDVDERSAILHRVADLFVEHADEIAEVLVREIAKNRKDSREEVVRSADFIRYTAEEGRRMAGETLFGDSFPGSTKNKIGFTFRVPLGVVLAIPPFNYPVNLAVSKIAPGLIAGNSVVLKPPTQGSVVAHYVLAVFLAAGVPAGVLSLATGRGSEIGDYLVQHPLVNMITFTGSSETGKGLAAKAQMVPLMLELGGKDAAIVLSDADLDRAAKEIVSGAFAYSGQRCTAVKRVLVSEPIADALVEKIVKLANGLTVGMPDENAAVTPLINSDAADYVQDLIEDANQAGAVPLTCIRREGNLIWPVVFDQVTTKMRLAWEEPFGPVLPVIRVRSADEAIAIANESEYGLQSSIFTRDADAALRIAARLEVGTVQFNGKTSRGPDHFPFLGTKSSGLGTQGVHYSIEAMTRVKSVVFNIDDRLPLSELR